MSGGAAPPTPDAALAALRARGDPLRAAETAARGAAGRESFGTSAAEIDALVKGWRETGIGVPERVALARALWDAGPVEARFAAARLLTQARIADDAAVWETILGWVPHCDGPAVADQVAKAGARRLVAAPARLDAVAAWTAPDRAPWTRRMALGVTLPWSRLRHLSAEDAARRERVLGWAAAYASEPDRLLQTALVGWLRSLAKHDPARVRAFLDAHGPAMRPHARREAEAALG
ncbi:MAG: DNA alkylation repair protein [Paracoccaceae bacterium]